MSIGWLERGISQGLRYLFGVPMARYHRSVVEACRSCTRTRFTVTGGKYI